jgi:segregation and condensation protein B
VSERPRGDGGEAVAWELPSAAPDAEGAPPDARAPTESPDPTGAPPDAGAPTESPDAGGRRGDEPTDHEPARAPAPPDLDDADLPRVVEALLFLSPDPLSAAELADATEADDDQVSAALAALAHDFAAGRRGVRLREVGGGYALASDPVAEAAARRLFSKPRVGTLTPAQAETLAIVAYLQPISRPEISRIRGVSADSASATLLERALIEESGRSQFGAVLYRTTPLFLKLFGLRTIEELPDVAQWDPTPEEQAELRDRLLRAGEARGGGGPSSE